LMCIISYEPKPITYQHTRLTVVGRLNVGAGQFACLLLRIPHFKCKQNDSSNDGILSSARRAFK